MFCFCAYLFVFFAVMSSPVFRGAYCIRCKFTKFRFNFNIYAQKNYKILLFWRFFLVLTSVFLSV